MKRKIGAHVSASGGIDKAIERAEAIGCNCVQLFSGSPRIWMKKNIAEIDFEKVYSKSKELSVEPIFTHALYLVNLASDKPDLIRKSMDSILYELTFDAQINGAGVVVHVGSHQGRGWDVVKDDVVKRIRQVIKKAPASSTFLIENSAGQKGKLHSDLEELKWTLDQLSDLVEQDRVGWCFDTCHAHAAGYYLGKSEPSLDQDIKKMPAQKKTSSRGDAVASALEEINSLELWNSLKCLHVNDSKDAFNSGRDRHQNIGDGQIPLEDLKYFLNQPQLESIPIITEVPGIDGKGPDKENIQRIKKLFVS